MALVLWGYLLMVVVASIGAGAKKMGVPDALLPWLTLILSLVGAASTQVINRWPGTEPVLVTIALAGLVVWFASTGLYETVKRFYRASRR